ncbi:hypothetical protein PRIPAC_94641 [Pristionchus pacificus]|uniref:Uncharacterized protein n=1 Tax=Pristionchus pacificus TaxID=54126 RepID=A0A2A6BAM5_PRIPA|nr:hypothetical protein PRIPAC_94641 [Pristionchus pacificus]|eukprot:PDM62917.1 hypothetical protein PRIPAC_50132 [Pristionchus pacificus]
MKSVIVALLVVASYLAVLVSAQLRGTSVEKKGKSKIHIWLFMTVFMTLGYIEKPRGDNNRIIVKSGLELQGQQYNFSA